MKESLDICFKTANILKSEFPNDVMKIQKNTIIEYKKENFRLLGNRKRNSMSRCFAYYTLKKPHRIVIRQKTLKDQLVHSTYGGRYSLTPNMQRYADQSIFKCPKCKLELNGETLYFERPVANALHGNWALIDLMCHEFAHHRTKGHAKGFKLKYHRFLNHMTNQVISGKFYL